MKIQSSLHTKNAYTIEFIAKYFIQANIGDRILTISQFEELVDVARGTIQNSIKILSSVGAISLESRGQLGTYLRQKNNKILLKYAGISFLIGVMPLPYSIIYEGLSTAILYTMENELGIPVNMAYMRGAQRRIQMVLNERYDFAIISKFAANHYIESNQNISVITEFEPGSYLSEHVLIFGSKDKNSIEDGMRIGIDYDSIDQSLLTKEVCKNKSVEYIHVSYTHLIDKLKTGEIDATVWNGDELESTMDDIHTVTLPLKDNTNTIAVVIINSQRHELHRILTDLIDQDEVIRIQQQVINGDIIPSY